MSVEQIENWSNFFSYYDFVSRQIYDANISCIFITKVAGQEKRIRVREWDISIQEWIHISQADTPACTCHSWITKKQGGELQCLLSLVFPFFLHFFFNMYIYFFTISTTFCILPFLGFTEIFFFFVLFNEKPHTKIAILYLGLITWQTALVIQHWS